MERKSFRYFCRAIVRTFVQSRIRYQPYRGNVHFSLSIFRILPMNETFGCRQNGTFPRATRNASHSSQSVRRLQVDFGQGQSSRMTGDMGVYSSLHRMTA